MATENLSFGEKLNNPFNLRTGCEWVGLTGESRGFCIFDSMKNGIRAAFITLRTYYQVHGLRTIRSIITRWAPATENNTEGYIYKVAKRLGKQPDKTLNFETSDDLLNLMEVIYEVETGHKASCETLEMFLDLWTLHLKSAFWKRHEGR